jgi:hypothetical protein
MPVIVEGVNGLRRRQHWIVVVFPGVVTRAGAVRYVVVVVFEDCTRVGARRDVKRRRRCMMNVTLVEV